MRLELCNCASCGGGGVWPGVLGLGLYMARYVAPHPDGVRRSGGGAAPHAPRRPVLWPGGHAGGCAEPILDSHPAGPPAAPTERVRGRHAPEQAALPAEAATTGDDQEKPEEAASAGLLWGMADCYGGQLLTKAPGHHAEWAVAAHVSCPR